MKYIFFYVARIIFTFAYLIYLSTIYCYMCYRCIQTIRCDCNLEHLRVPGHGSGLKKFQNPAGRLRIHKKDYLFALTSSLHNIDRGQAQAKGEKRKEIFLSGAHTMKPRARTTSYDFFFCVYIT